MVAADDGVMPQTIEAINHAKAAEVPIVVAVNKIDKPGANPDRVRQELTEYGVIPEEWGGSNMFVEVSAKKKLHIDDLLETIILQADVLELKANPDASGFRLRYRSEPRQGSRPRGHGAHPARHLQAGDVRCRWRELRSCARLSNPHGNHAKQATPSDPGRDPWACRALPTAGDEFRVFEDERDARKLAEERAMRARLKEQQTKSHMSLDDLFNRIEEGTTELNLVVKADVQGSIEGCATRLRKWTSPRSRFKSFTLPWVA